MSRAPVKREWAAYVRVSQTRGRSGDSFHSPAQQEQEIRRRADGDVVQVFVDLDYSGTNINRPELRKMLDWLREDPKRRGVGVYDYSRLSRRMKDSLDLAEEIKQMGAVLMSVKEDIDTSTANGEHMFHTFVSMHHLQARMIGERWKSIQQKRVDAGLDPGGPPRFGYRKVTDGSTQVQQIDPVTGPILAQMYRDYVNGQGFKLIAQSLNGRGITTRRGNTWTLSALTRTMDGGWGAGLVVTENGGSFRKGQHEAVITPEEWEAYQRARQTRRLKHPKRKAPQWFLSGLVKCGLCGASMNINSYTAVKSQAQCATYKAGRPCTGVWINRLVVERRVGLWLGGQVDEWAAQSAQKVTSDGERAAAAVEVTAAEDLLRRLRESKKELFKMRSRQEMSNDEYRELLTTTESDIAKAVAQYEVSRSRAEALNPLDDVYDRIAQGVEGMTPPEWNQLLTRIIDRVVVTKDEMVIHPTHGDPSVIKRSRTDAAKVMSVTEEAQFGIYPAQTVET